MLQLLGAILYIAPLVLWWYETRDEDKEDRDGMGTWFLVFTTYYLLTGYLYWGRG